MRGTLKIQPQPVIIQMTEGELDPIVNEILDVIKKSPTQFLKAIAVLQEAERRIMEQVIKWD